MTLSSSRLTHLLALTAMAATLFGCSASKPEAAVADFFTSVATGEHDKALRMLDPRMMSMLPESKIRAGFASMRADAEKCGGFKAIEPQLTGDGNTRRGTVVLTYSSSNCKPATRKVELSNIDGKWLLLM